MTVTRQTDADGIASWRMLLELETYELWRFVVRPQWRASHTVQTIDEALNPRGDYGADPDDAELAMILSSFPFNVREEFLAALAEDGIEP